MVLRRVLRRLTHRAGIAAAVAIAIGTIAGAPHAQSTDARVPRLRNVAHVAGLTHRLEHSPTAEKHLIETMTGGVAAFDYDNDGLTDLFFVNGAAQPSLQKTEPRYWNRLYRNRGQMRFEDVTERAGVPGEGYAMGAAVGDYDNDGDTDLFVAGVGRNLLYRNRGNGTFENVTASSGISSRVWSVAGGWFDYNGDGYLDLFVVNYVQWDPTKETFCGDRARDLRVYCHPKFYEGLPNTLYRNRGDGTFEDASASAGIGRHVGKGMSAAFADYDGDGLVDVFVTNDGVPNFLFRNSKSGAFEEVGLLAGVALPAHGRPVSSMGVDFRDVTGDGRPDLSVTALRGETFPLFVNEGATFRDATYASGLGGSTVGRSGWGNALADIDNDGRPDLFTANAHVNDLIDKFEASPYLEPNALFLNRGNGRFEDVSASVGEEFMTPRAHRGAAVADFNNDGRLDIVVTVLGGEPELWEHLGPAGRWVRVNLEGQKSNRDGIGARVAIDDQVNLRTTTVGYASASDQGVHLGLGARTMVETMTVTWPSGLVQTLKNVKADQVVDVREAASRPNRLRQGFGRPP
jgi:enediyne biosynthesis protein E4